MSRTGKIIEKIIKNEDMFTVFYNDWCGYSRNALKVLKNNKQNYKGYNIDNIDGKMDRLLQELSDNKDTINFDIGHKTRPIVFYGGKFIGGYDDLVEYLKKKGQKNWYLKY